MTIESIVTPETPTPRQQDLETLTAIAHHLPQAFRSPEIIGSTMHELSQQALKIQFAKLWRSKEGRDAVSADIKFDELMNSGAHSFFTGVTRRYVANRAADQTDPDQTAEDILLFSQRLGPVTAGLLFRKTGSMRIAQGTLQSMHPWDFSDYAKEVTQCIEDKIVERTKRNLFFASTAGAGVAALLAAKRQSK